VLALRLALPASAALGSRSEPIRIRLQEDSLAYRIVVPLVTVDVICHARPEYSAMGPASVVRSTESIERLKMFETNRNPLQSSGEA
jgi:hypothetical protein